jgi:hypothetical protein
MVVIRTQSFGGFHLRMGARLSFVLRNATSHLSKKL